MSVLNLTLNEQAKAEMRAVLQQVETHLRRQTLPQRLPAPVFGGYLRDTLLGYPPTDMDVLVPSEANMPPVGWRKLRPAEMVGVPGDERFFVRMNTMEYDGGLVSGSGMRVQSLGYYDVPGVRVPVNLIYSNCQPASLEGFARVQDFGINQIAYDGRQLFATEAFLYDYFNRLMTYNAARDNDSRKHAQGRALRLAPPRNLKVVWPYTIPLPGPAMQDAGVE